MTILRGYLKIEAAVILGFMPNIVRTWAKNEKLPVHRNPANDYRLIRRADLESFLLKITRSQRTKTESIEIVSTLPCQPDGRKQLFDRRSGLRTDDARKSS